MCAVYVMYYLLSINVWSAIDQVVSCWHVPAGTRFYIRQVCVGLVVGKITETGFPPPLKVLRFSPATVILSVLHTH